ncbi:ABC transporter ATP-binding protein [Palleronia sp. KMU-117]|uniref:ABC transporter ATP-binding protein n=1 Tax=Palleronia sp. KMU-117 TaxID=3434108 RepID=UPI003D706C24
MLLSVEDLRKSFPGDAGPVAVLDGVSMTLGSGQTLALTGESGSGKSTFLHVVAGLETADAGRVRVAGHEVTTMNDAARAALRRGTVGLIFQQFNLIPSLDVTANIAFQARLSGRHDPDWCAALIDRLGLGPQARSFPEQLSGGQQQRVAVARTLAARPALVLADEPTGNLDEATGDAVLALMLGLVAETGAALLMVTHSARLAARLDRRLHLSHGRLR